MQKTSLNLLGVINLSLLFLITGCESEIKVKGGAVATTDTSSVTNRGQLDVTAAWLGAGNYSGYNAASLPVTEVCSTSTIFGAQGTAACGGSVNTFADLMASMAFKSDNNGIDLSDPLVIAARVQATLADEGAANATFTTHHALVPNPASDHDGFGDDVGGGANPKKHFFETVKGGRPETVCGLTGATIQDRVTLCQVNGAKAIYEGEKYGQGGEGTWELVTLYSTAGGLVEGTTQCAGGKAAGCFEVWRDARTGLIWSDLHDNGGNYYNWFKAAGYSSTASTVNETGYEGEAGSAQQDCYTDTSYGVQTSCQPAIPVSVCADAGVIDGLNGVSPYTNPDGNNGTVDERPNKGNLTAATHQWRLPTREDYFLAMANGMLKVLPNIEEVFWSASSYSRGRLGAWVMGGNGAGYVDRDDRSGLSGVRCVGR